MLCFCRFLEKIFEIERRGTLDGFVKGRRLIQAGLLES